MAIIRYTKDSTAKYAYLNIFPDQFKTERQKKMILGSKIQWTTLQIKHMQCM